MVTTGDVAEGLVQRRAHMKAALTALRHVVEAAPRLAGLLASRPALAPLLTCVEPVCRCASDTPLSHSVRSVHALVVICKYTLPTLV